MFLCSLFPICIEYSSIEIYKMLKTQILTKIDTCLKSYVNENNSRYKRSINTIFMDRAQLKNFYHDMREEKESQKMEQLEKKGQKSNIRKSKSCFIKGNKILDWRNFDRIQINQKALISNFSGIKQRRQNSAIKKQAAKVKQNNFQLQLPEQDSTKYNSQIPLPEVFQFYSPPEQSCKYLTDKVPIPTFSQNFTTDECKQFDRQQLEAIRKQQQQKCINKYRLKLGKKQFKPSEELKFQSIHDRSLLEKSRNEEKNNRKLTMRFENFIQGMKNDLFREGNKQIDGVRKQIKKKDQISNAIRAYFIKNNRDFKLRIQTKQNSLFEKYLVGKQKIKSEFKANFSKNKKNIVI